MRGEIMPCSCIAVRAPRPARRVRTPSASRVGRSSSKTSTSASSSSQRNVGSSSSTATARGSGVRRGRQQEVQADAGAEHPPIRPVPCGPVVELKSVVAVHPSEERFGKGTVHQRTREAALAIFQSCNVTNTGVLLKWEFATAMETSKFIIARRRSADCLSELPV